MATIGAELVRTLDRHLPEAGPCAVLGYPRGRNVGDYLIWLGTIEQLRRRRLDPVYLCDRTGYAPRVLAARLGGEGTILLAGGGNLGDLWPDEQRFREQVVADFPDTPILQLPQSMHFRSEASLERARKAFAAHPSFTLLLRDPVSEAAARDAFGDDRTAHCPDMAFGMPRVEAPAQPGEGILWLARDDHESRHPPTETLPPGVRRWDWATGHGRPFAWGLARRLGTSLVGDGTARRLPPTATAGHALVRTAGDRLARGHLARGVEGLTGAEVVVTDRLHGHILSLVLGLTQVVLDNGDGKVLSVVRRWTGASPRVHVATSAASGVELARALLGAGGGRAR